MVIKPFLKLVEGNKCTNVHVLSKHFFSAGRWLPRADEKMDKQIKKKLTLLLLHLFLSLIKVSIYILLIVTRDDEKHEKQPFHNT